MCTSFGHQDHVAGFAATTELLHNVLDRLRDTGDPAHRQAGLLLHRGRIVGQSRGEKGQHVGVALVGD